MLEELLCGYFHMTLSPVWYSMIRFNGSSVEVSVRSVELEAPGCNHFFSAGYSFPLSSFVPSLPGLGSCSMVNPYLVPLSMGSVFVCGVASVTNNSISHSCSLFENSAVTNRVSPLELKIPTSRRTSTCARATIILITKCARARSCARKI